GRAAEVKPVALAHRVERNRSGDHWNIPAEQRGDRRASTGIRLHIIDSVRRERAGGNLSTGDACERKNTQSSGCFSHRISNLFSIWFFSDPEYTPGPPLPLPSYHRISAAATKHAEFSAIPATQRESVFLLKHDKIVPRTRPSDFAADSGTSPERCKKML